MSNPWGTRVFKRNIIFNNKQNSREQTREEKSVADNAFGSANIFTYWKTMLNLYLILQSQSG